MTERDTCDECGFDASRWKPRDCATLFGALGWWWEHAPTDGPEPSAWSVLPSGDPDGDGDGVHHAHLVSHQMFDISRALAARGTAPVLTGTVEQLNVSKGGVPKLPVERVSVGTGGVAGDVQKERRHHGRQFQALCLWSAEVVEELAGAGHPISFGSAGENVTVRGVDWAELRPGVLVRIGGVTAELSFPAVPCKKQIPWFSDGDFRRIAYERNPQWVRWYAWVREPGLVNTGDGISSVVA